MAANTRFSHYVTRPVARVIPIVITAVVFSSLVAGWLQRDEGYLTPESGLGYQLGIYGSVAMLVLLIYSYRKRVKTTPAIGSIPFWFRTHMFLGIFGPVLIMFHSNFRLGSMNSNVALFAMLTVVASGIIGKYIYGKIHMGLYGRKAEAKEILAEAEALKNYLGEEMQAAAYVAAELSAFSEQIRARPPSGAVSSLWAGGILAVRARVLRARLLSEARRMIRREGKLRRWSWWRRHRSLVKVRQVVTLYVAVVLKAAALTFYERLFALWHVLHLPLFFLMLLAGIVHVWAVHQY